MFTGDRTLTFATNGSIAIPYFKLRSQAILLTFTIKKIKIRLFITPILGLLGRGRSQTVNCQLSTVNC
ncbi:MULTISPECIES: hypothetical protein [unclassified Microcoleus]|uniref:hypothetical protein n=1 Tax=unclassified Microcoleus TaxID=2642155 RepID=UPI001D97602E|nr:MULTISPECIES: hypothetical protein [unclassified Microcoleus]MCC3512399.1 hypothetical protein [Microcoleus sp. PH2017_17_BER_D_A]MCC3550933.1 hypothetical protein [Microcoleus sp. PH2017_24_DOB_U_A]MCC3574902.1 hypothetical protein [Microcoleus sp. PH2017_34_RAT_O_A]